MNIATTETHTVDERKVQRTGDGGTLTCPNVIERRITSSRPLRGDAVLTHYLATV